MDESGELPAPSLPLFFGSNNNIAFQEQLDYYHKIIHTLPTAIYTTNMEGYIMLYNDAAAELWGRRPVVGKDLWCGSWRIYRPDGTLLPLEECPMALTLRGGHSVSEEIVVERVDGTRLHVMPHPKLLYDDSGQPVGAVNLLVDITARKQTDEALGESKQRTIQLSTRLKALLKSTSRLIETLETEELLSSLLTIASELVNVDALGLWRTDRLGVWTVIASTGLSDNFVRESLESIQNSPPLIEPVIVQPEDMSQRTNPLLAKRWARYEQEGIRTLMILPLVIHGESTGTLVFYRRLPQQFTEVEIESAQALTNIASAAITTAELYDTQSRLRREAEETAVRETFLANAGTLLSESLDYEKTLANVARVAVPHFADWCAVDLLDDQGMVQRLSVAHIDPRKVALAQEIYRKYPPNPNSTNGVVQVIRTGEPVLVPEIPDKLLEEAAGEDKEYLQLMRELEIASYICIPLRAGGTVYGAISFVRSGPNHLFEERDLNTGQEIALRAAQAIANAKQYRDRKHAEAALRQLTESLEERVQQRTKQVRKLVSQLTKAEQEERRRISQVLHDELQQLLSALSMKLNTIHQDVQVLQQPDLLQMLEEGSEWIDQAITLTRQLTVDFSPPLLKNQGLTDALEWLQRQMGELHGLDVVVEADHQFYIADENLQILLFQIVRELLFNVKKHANIKQATVKIEESEDHLIIHVVDKGRGFDVPQVEARQEQVRGFGLFSIRERINLLGGHLHIHSQPGEGTDVAVYVPAQPVPQQA